MKENWPNFLVIGAAKCGTTSLYHYLKSHPEVYMSPIKEPNYFSTDINPEEFSKQYKDIEKRKNLRLDEYIKGDMKREVWGYFVREKAHYTGLFKLVTNEKAIGEISNSYLFSKVAAQNIKKTLPGIKLIAILRNPVERIYSHYLANLRDGKTFKPFRPEIEEDQNKERKGWYINHGYVEMGMYYEQVKRYMDLFPPNQLLIILYDDLKKHPDEVLKKICRFLQIDEGFSFKTSIHFNEARIPRNPKLLYWLSSTGLKKSVFRIVPSGLQPEIKNIFFKAKADKRMSEGDRMFAYQFYREEIPKLERLLNCDLSNWKMPDTP